MSTIGKAERVTQNRVIALFRDELKYRYLGDWSDRAGNSNIEEGLLKDYLTSCSYSPEQISRAILPRTMMISGLFMFLYFPTRTQPSSIHARSSRPMPAGPSPSRFWSRMRGRLTS
jgi:hypothetical protein